MAAKINATVLAAIENLVKEGSKIEFGILEIISNPAIGVFAADKVPFSFINGDEVWVRKNGMPVGASRDETLNKNFYSPQNPNILKIKIDEEWWVRMSIDQNALNSIGRTYSGQDLKDQLKAVLLDGLTLSLKAKFDSVMIKTFHEMPDKLSDPTSLDVADVVSFDVTGLKNSTTPLESIIGAYRNIAFAISDIESSISSFRVGVSASLLSATVQPIMANLANDMILRYGGNDKAADNIRNGNPTKLFDIPFIKHPFFNQLVNSAATDLNNIDRKKTIFDATDTYDFTGLVGLILHSESGLLPMKFNSFTMILDPTTANLIVLARVGYGVGIPRPGLVLKIVDGGKDQQVYIDELKAFGKWVEATANAIVVASGSPIAADLETAIKAYAGASTTADFSKATVTSTDPTNAGTVTVPTVFKAVIKVPLASGKVAQISNAINISPYYKNT